MDVNASLRNKENRDVSVFRADNGTEYKNDELVSFCARKDIHFQRCVPYKHAQNGKAERMIRTVTEGALASLLHSTLAPYSLISC